ncbi:MAG: tetratricopeptide repeat protein [Pyrinomonadaceae bacterium]
MSKEDQTIERGPNREPVIIAALGLLVLAIYYQTTGFGFINFDDNLYVYENPVVKSGLHWETVRWAFGALWSANWHPLTWLSHAADVQLFGLNPGGHHAVNVLLHLVNSILAFVVFRRMTGETWPSAFVAALFAVHPAHVESVAWIAERKDVLSTAFWLLAMYAYAGYAESSAAAADSLARRWKSKSYILTAALLALGLMAKPMLVTLPFVLLLSDYWPLRRMQAASDVRWLVVEKIPLFVLTAASSVVTFLAQRSAGAVESLSYLPLAKRVANAVVSYSSYIATLFYPLDLAVYYPYRDDISAAKTAGAALLLIAVTAVCWRLARRRRYLLFGWLWYLGTLVPVIGLVQIGSQALADRYTYFPYFGLFVMIVWTVWELLQRTGSSAQRAALAASAVIVLILALVSHRQAAYWKDNETLYTRTLAVTGDNYIISHNLCYDLITRDRLDEAEPYCRRSIEIKPTYYNAYNTLGIADFKRGQYASAETNFKIAVDNAPDFALGYVNLAQAQSRQGKAAEAEATLRKAAESAGNVPLDVFASALADIASAYAEHKDYAKAAENLRRLVYVRPFDPSARSRLALMLHLDGRDDEAAPEIAAALEIDPNDPAAHNIAGMVAAARGDRAEAEVQFEQALQLKPDYQEAKDNLAKLKGAK